MDEIIQDTLARREAQDVAMLFVDESHFSNEPYVHRGWQRVKVKQKVTQPKHRQSRTIFGAVDLESQRVYWKQASRGNARTFIAFLHQLHQSFPAQLLVLILDNCSIHHSKQVKAFVAKTPWLQLEPLAPYSPEYNPIERFWHWLKRKIYGLKSYPTMDELVAKIRTLLWHYNEGRLVTTIRFNFSAYVRLL